MNKLFAEIESYEKDMLTFLETIVNIESGKDNPEGIKDVATQIGNFLQALNFEVEYIDVPNITTHLRAIKKSSDPNAKNIMIIGHMDTVFKTGTVAERPFTIKGEKAHGPGVLDMKSGITLAIHTLKALHALGLEKHNVEVFFCGDEECGHERSNAKQLHLEYGQNKDAVFNMETGSDKGTIVFGRRGTLFPKIRVEGKSAHSGKDPEKGASAILQMAHILTEMYKINDPEAGISFNAGIIQGGVASNGIAALCTVDGDFRFKTVPQLDEIVAHVRKVEAMTFVPGTKTTIDVDLDRGFMPMEMTEDNLALYKIVKEQGDKYGIPVEGIYVGASSDSCYTTMAGSATICAMGARGEYNHSENEYIIIESLVERSKLLAASILAI